MELTEVATVFIAKAAPSIPPDLMRKISEFVVIKTLSYADTPWGRSSMDFYDSNWEEFPLPLFDWPWPELKTELSTHEQDLPEPLCHESRTTFGNRNLDQWRKELRQRPASHYLEQCPMKDLRQFQKQYALTPARTKIGLVELIASMDPLPDNIRAVVEDSRRDDLHQVDAEEEARKQPLPELYKNHLITLAQIRVDSYFEAVHSSRSPQSQRRDDEKRTLKAAQREFGNAKHLDLAAEELSLRAAFAADLGPKWERRKAAKLAFTKMMNDNCWRVSASLNDFVEKHREIKSRLIFASPEDRSRLVLRQTCPLCQKRDTYINFRTQDDLPPFHLLCTCLPPIWEVDHFAIRPSKSSSGPLLGKAINEFIGGSLNDTGIGIRTPTISTLVTLIEAGMMDDENAKQRTALARLIHKSISGVRRIFTQR